MRQKLNKDYWLGSTNAKLNAKKERYLNPETIRNYLKQDLIYQWQMSAILNKDNNKAANLKK